MVAPWFFEPSKRVRRGGSAAEYAFNPGLDVFVREVIQNSKDQKRRDAVVHVHFELIRLRDNSLRSFQEVCGWDSLEGHVRNAGEQNPNARALKRGVEALHSTKEMLLLRIDDEGTGGLIGGDLERDRPFASLCIDELFSTKESAGAGGSYGLGKSVLWRFSQFSTVLFSSYPAEYPPGGSGLRIFGRAQLPWHKIDSESFDGTCWFGERQGDTALSWWGTASAALAPILHLDRPRSPGTSILVVGFRPPAEEYADAEIPSRLTDAASEHFWPVLGDGEALAVTSSLVDAETGTTLEQLRASVGPKHKPFQKCLERFRSGDTTLDLTGPDDVARADLELSIPARVDGSAPATTGRVSLCVTLAVSGAKPRVDTVAETRGFGMVVRYRELKSLSLSARHFHAVLICGTLHGSSPEDYAVEEFLRLAEPPAHNEWSSTPRLREAYKRGYGTAIEKLERAVVDALKRLVSQSSAAGETGPELLSRLFPIGERGAQEREHGFRVVEREAILQADGRWHFSGRVERTKGTGPWHISVQLRPATEDGADSGSLIGAIEAAPSAVQIAKGRADITVSEGTRRVSFRGTSDPSRHPTGGRRVAVRLDVSAAETSVTDGP